MLEALIFLMSRLQSSSLILRFFGVRLERVQAFQAPLLQKDESLSHAELWFHAASVGELEMLAPLIDDALECKISVGLSCFSDSANPYLERYRGKVAFCKLSPKEEDWIKLFKHYGVRKLIISKYDLWPGLAYAASKLRVPVDVVNARWGSSLRVLQVLFASTCTPLPILRFFVNSREEQSVLQAKLSEAQVHLAINPREERIRRRISRSLENEAFQEIVRECQFLGHPLGVFGSVWCSDLEVVLPVLQNTIPDAYGIFVPHDLSQENLNVIELKLESTLHGRYYLVREPGVLLELYSLGDFAYVGGGFGKGIHSTLEPAVQGIPVICGPEGIEKFPEIKVLKERGILRVCGDVSTFESSLKSFLNRTKTTQAFLHPGLQYEALLEECLRIG